MDAVTTWLDLPIGPVRCRTAGQGPPLLFVHGALVDSRLWDAVARRLSSDHTVVLPDLPLGAHERPVADARRLTPSSVADSLIDLMDALDLPKATLVGNDTGGAIAQIAAARHGDRIDQLILTSCDAFEHFPPRVVRPFLWLGWCPPLLRLVGWAFGAIRGRSSPLWRLLARTGLDGATAAAWMRPIRTSKAVRRDTAALLRSVRPADTLDAAARLRHYHGDVLVAWSTDDLVFPRSDARRLAEQVPRAELQLIDGARTFSSLERPERLAGLIRDFTSRSAGEGAVANAPAM